MTNYELSLLYSPTSEIGMANYELICLQNSCNHYYADPFSQFYQDLCDEIQLEETIKNRFRPVEGICVTIQPSDEDKIELPF